MTLRERIDRLDPRERRLLVIFAAVLGSLLVLAIPAAALAVTSSRNAANERLREALAEIQSERATIQRAGAVRQAVQQRYGNAAPPLAGLLERWAQEAGITIPESQDRPVVPHGKQYDERSTKLVLRKVGMLNLARFMEKIQQTPHPLSIERLNIRKRGTEPDSYDVDMVVSAYDRKVRAESAQGSGAVAEEGGTP